VKLVWSARAWSDYQFWVEHEVAMARKIHSLLGDVQRTPFRGLGKPEPLKTELQGWWSRRISREHRLVYRVVGQDAEQRVEIAQCRYHYK
jgi:toxin YoeB